MAVPVTNFGLVTVSTVYGAGDTSIVLTTGHGSKLPATTGGYQYPLTWWDSTNYPHPADDPNVEIILVTARSGDTLTVTRAQEGTSASTKSTGSGAVYRMSLGVTKALWESMRVKSMHQGLVLRTDRDASDASKKVEIAALDYLIMDDGTVFDNSDDSWTGKAADITASGAGGLDTGAETGGLWYDIYAIATETGTKNLLLHKSKRWSDEASYTINEDASQNVGSATSNSFVSQGFKLSSSGKLKYAQVKLQTFGSPTGNIACAVYSDNAGVPGSALSVAHYFDITHLDSTATWVHFTFPHSAPTLSASPTQYHLVIGVTVNASNYLQWRMDGSAGAYADGAKATWNGSAWTTDTDDDMMFVIGLEVDTASVTMPSTYTKKCLLGWVFNNGSSDFIPFVQNGRSRRDIHVTYGNNRIATLSGDFTISKSYCPAIPAITLMLGCTGTGTQSGIAVIGEVTRSTRYILGNTDSGLMTIYSGGTSTRPGPFYPVIVTDGVFTAQGNSGCELWIAGFSW